MIDSTVNGERCFISSKGIKQKIQHGKELEELINRFDPPVAPKEKRMLNDYHRIYYKEKEGMNPIIKDRYALRQQAHDKAYACVESCIEHYNKGRY